MKSATKRSVLLAVLAVTLGAAGCYSDRDFPANPSCSSAYPQCPSGQTCVNDKCVDKSADGGGGGDLEPGKSGVTTSAGSVMGFKDGQYSSAKFHWPVSLLQVPGKGLYVVDSHNHAIRLLAGGKVTTVAGTGKEGFSDGPGNVAQFNTPYDLAAANDGTLYVADRLNHLVREIKGEKVTVMAGTGVAGFKDGAVSMAQFNNPTGLAVDSSGVIYVADQMNRRIRMIKKGGGLHLRGRRHPGLPQRALAQGPVLRLV